MKRFASLLLALLLLTLSLPALAEGEELTLEGSMLNGFGYGVGEWTNNEASRATFVTLSMLDAVLSGDERVSDVATEALLEGKIYVAADADSVSCYIFGTSLCLMVDYTPGVGSRAFIIDPAGMAPEEKMEALKTSLQLTDCWDVNAGDVLTMMQIVVDALVQ